MSRRLLSSAAALLCLTSTISAQSNSSAVVSIPFEYTYLLPDGYTDNVNTTFVNGTTTSNASINSLLQAANRAPFISYDEAFLSVVGPNPEPQLIQQRDTLFAYEAGVWVPERNEVWFTSSVSQGTQIPTMVNVLNLGTNAVYELNGTSSPIVNPNGGYYFEGKVYIATVPSNTTYRGGIISVDPVTLEVETVVNNYFGLPFNGPDDIVWVKQGNDAYMYFTDLNFEYLEYGNNYPTPSLPAGVWRWDPQEQVLLQVITRNELNPNGVRVSPDQRTLYVTDSTDTFSNPAPWTPPLIGPAAVSWLGPYIYQYDLDAGMFPVNRKPFGLVREGIADGIHCDDAGNVWTGEPEGIVVRNPQGKIIGVVNQAYFVGQTTGVPLANFAIAGDTLVVLGVDKLYTVKLAKTIVSSSSSIVN